MHFLDTAGDQYNINNGILLTGLTMKGLASFHLAVHKLLLSVFVVKINKNIYVITLLSYLIPLIVH